MRLGPVLVAALVVTGCGAQRTSTQVPGEGAMPAERAGDGVTRGDGAVASTGKNAGATAKPDAGGGSTPGDGLPASVVTAKAHSDGNHYAIDAKAPGTVGVGGRGELEIVLVAKDGYHINDEFPYKLKTASKPVGIVTFETPELSRAQGAYTKTEARFQARFVGGRAGAGTIGGTMALSVCTQKECVTDRIELEVPVTVR